MRALIILTFICLVSNIMYAQQNFIRWNENQPLQWSDFGGQVKDTSWLDAECFAEVGYSYTFQNLKNFQFDVFAHFHRDISWIKKENQTEALLKHEQLHFDIAELFSIKIKELFESYNYTVHFEKEIQFLFNKKKEEYHLMQHQYDHQTNHSLNKEKQKEWEVFISNELRQMKYKQQIAKSDVTPPKDLE